MSVTAFWHIAQMNHWRTVVHEQSRLLACLPEVVVGCLGAEPLPGLPGNFKVGYQGHDLEAFEYPTLDLLWDHCQAHNGLVLYIHTKGVSYGPDVVNKIGYHWRAFTPEAADRFFRNLREWRRYMEFFLLSRKERCWGALRGGCDLAGVHFVPHLKTMSQVTGVLPHFSGNCWWARTSYIRTLMRPSDFNRERGAPGAPRSAAEYWVVSGSPRVACLHSTPANIYDWGISWMDYYPIHA